jgi:hypothetical protein
MSENKNKTYTKEELLNLIKNNVSLPESADDFDKEALEGLKLVKNENVLNELNNEVDKLSKQKERKKFIYYFSAAASLLLLMGLFWLFKSEVKTTQEKVVADVATTQQETEKNPKTIVVAEEKQDVAAPVKEEKTKEKTAEPKISESIAQQHVAMAPVATSKDELDQTISVEKNTAATNEGNAEDAVVNNDVAHIDADTKSGGTIDREVFQQQANKNMNTMISTQAGVTIAEENKAKKTVVTPSAALAKSDVAKKEERVADNKTTKPNMFYSNSEIKNKTANKYTPPTFIGGDTAFVSYAKKHLKISSPNTSGKITISFMVTKKGLAEKIKIIKPIDNCEACSNDVIELIKSIKNWQPATINNKAVDCPKTLVVQYN